MKILKCIVGSADFKLKKEDLNSSDISKDTEIEIEHSFLRQTEKQKPPSHGR